VTSWKAECVGALLLAGRDAAMDSDPRLEISHEQLLAGLGRKRWRLLTTVSPRWHQRDLWLLRWRAPSDAFFAEFEETIGRIGSNPSYWQPLAGGSNKRKATMKRFPYVIVFRQVSEESVRVLVVKHQKRSGRIVSHRS